MTLIFTFFCCHQKKVTKKSHRSIKFAENFQRKFYNAGKNTLAAAGTTKERGVYSYP